MKTKNIFKALVLASVLVSACGKHEIVNNDKGYSLPVTINVSRQGDEPATRATYNESTRKLSFSTGDKLFVEANNSDAGQLAGLLDYDAVSGKFSGTIYTQSQYTGTVKALLESAVALMATLLPAGYDKKGYLSISNAGAYNADLSVARNKVFALEKKEAVEQLSFESVDVYDNGFALAPQNGVVCFSISGLAANTAVDVIFKEKSDDSATPVNVPTNASGVATFAVGMEYENFDNFSLTVDGNAIALPADKLVEAGKIYNMSRSAAPATDLSAISSDYTAQDGETLTGTLGSHVKISIADGATVTLKDVNITNLGDNFDWPGITCLGDATLVLEGTNEVCPGIDDTGEFSDYPAIYIAPGNTLTIQGAGTLTAYSNAYEPYGAGIGGGYDIPCGHIVINSGNIKAQGGYYAAGIGSGGYGGYCGDITINGGNIMATGGDCAAGIGSGRESGSCGTITIKSTVTSVTATKGDGSTNSIGAGQDSPAITVNIEDPSKVTQN